MVQSILVGAMALAVVVGPASPATAEDLVTFVGGTTRTISATTTSVTFPLELTAAATEDTAIGATVTEVLRGDASLAPSAVSAAVDAAPNLVLTIEEPDQFAVTASYSVTVLLDDATGNRQSVTVTLNQPAASLTNGSVVEVEIVESRLFGLGPTESRPELVLRVDRSNGISQLSAAQVERSEGQVTLTAGCLKDAKPTECNLSDGTVDLDPPVASDGSLQLGYDLDGFPLGTTTRTVDLVSPQLAAPVTVTFEVTKRRSPVWIIVIVFAGLLLGWLIRIALAKSIEWAQRASAKNDLEATIAGIRYRYEDEELRKRLADIASRLDSRKITADQIQALSAEVVTALAATNQWLAEAKTSTDAVADAIDGDWLLDERSRQELEQLRAALEAVRASLLAHDGGAAKKRATAAIQRVDALKAACVDWLSKYLLSVESTTTELAQFFGPPEPAYPLVDLKRALKEAATAAVLPPDADLGTHVRRCDASMTDFLGDVQPTLLEVVGHCRDHDAALARRTEKVVRGEQPSVAIGKAGPLLRQLLTLPPPPVGNATPGVTSKEGARADAEDTVVDAEVASVSGILPRYDVPFLRAIELAPARAFAITSRWLAELVRWLVLAVIVGLITYSVSEPNWVGTDTQIIALFGWAFVIDVSVQAVTAAFGNTGGATPPTLASDPQSGDNPLPNPA